MSPEMRDLVNAQLKRFEDDHSANAERDRQSLMTCPNEKRQNAIAQDRTDVAEANNQRAIDRNQQRADSAGPSAFKFRASAGPYGRGEVCPPGTLPVSHKIYGPARLQTGCLTEEDGKNAVQGLVEAGRAVSPGIDAIAGAQGRQIGQEKRILNPGTNSE
jgi:hypothetical protein